MLLGRKVTFRWTVSRRVRKEAKLRCSWRAYRSWLKSLSPEKLSEPVEIIHADLAVELDHALSARDTRWSSNKERTSNALRLVELTYPAVAAALGDSDRVNLTEAWQQSRSAIVRERLLELTGTGSALSIDDRASALLRRSDARRETRLQAFGVAPDAVRGQLDRIALPTVGDGKAVIVIGGFGSGKSEIAESWHRRALHDLRSTENAPIPVWMSAREVTHRSLDEAIRNQIGSGWWEQRGVRVAIDGLDEVEPGAAQAILDSARTFVHAQARSSAVLTARPGVVTAATVNNSGASTTQQFRVPPLDRDDALALVEAVSGTKPSTWKWPTEVLDSLSQPFFALAAGALLGSARPPTGEVDLIRQLVEQALSRPTESATIASADTRAALTKLAISLTREDESKLDFHDVHIARLSRLTVDRGGRTEFALPIFQQWFAAQAVIDGSAPTMEIVADAGSFGKWRWAAAIALASTSDPIQIDSLVASWLMQNVGATAWIIGEALRDDRFWRRNAGPALEPMESGTRLLYAYRTWRNALGPAARRSLPPSIVRGPVEIGVTTHGRGLSISFPREANGTDAVAVLTAAAPFSPGYDDERWHSTASYGSVPDGPAWPWALVRVQAARAMLDKLNADPNLGGDDGLWIHEWRYDLALEVTGLTKWERPSVSVPLLRRRLSELSRRVPFEPQNSFALRGARSISGSELSDLAAWCDSTDTTELSGLVPPPDLPPTTGHWIWDVYSLEGLMAFEVEAYGYGCDAYDESLATHFASFGWSMAGTMKAPFGVALTCQAPSDAGPEERPGFTAMRVPMALLEEIAQPDESSIWSSNGRAVISLTETDQFRNYEGYERASAVYRGWLEHEQIPFDGGIGISSFGPTNVREPRPASSVAASWLWRDLEKLHLGSGTFPQLR